MLYLSGSGILPVTSDYRRQRSEMNPDELRESVNQAYSQIAESPQQDAPFPTGRALAESLGYLAGLLNSLPVAAVEAFCGVSTVSLFAEIPAGSTVLDLGCGSGTDALVAARRTGPHGKVFAVDFSISMIQRAREAAAQSAMQNVEILLSDAERLPVEHETIDVALVNGIFNLNPFRSRIFSELCRVVKPGGAVYAAELILAKPLSEKEKSTLSWFC
ncbi:MAG TPA: methyltransferase domain-containing protein [Chthonomonadales bacterium]|nr:methyltransferase domain-containing protein [Chthonomonadales bacterium]